MMRSMITSQPISRRDIVIAVVLSLLGVVLMIANVSDPEVGGDASVAIVPAFLVVTAPLLWRRRAPLLALAATLAALGLHIALFGDLTRCGVLLPATFVLVFAAAAWLELRPALLGLLLGVALVLAVSASDQQVALADAPPFCAFAAIFWGIGRVVRSRGRMVRALEVQTIELRDARDERARLEVATDRARLSGELDELLQRRLAELARLADAGSTAGDPQAATAALVEIEHQGRSTLNEMRAIVGVLRERGDDAPTAPQPTLTHLEAMLLRARGEDAALTIEGSPRALPAGVELSAYRIVEHLLAALDDAPGVDVRVRFADEAIELTVSGPARRGSGAAIDRARERTRLHRGTLEATVRDGRAQAVALLPLATG
jgi:signal transduction histidine kinase